MHVVVNHLHLREPIAEATALATQGAVQRVVDAGGLRRRSPRSATRTSS